MIEPVGHDRIRAMLGEIARRVAAGEDAAIQHAWLFAGPPGVGKFRIARWWAASLKCPQAGACEAATGSRSGSACESCRLVAAAAHPDVFETGPARKDKKALQGADDPAERARQFSIDQSRDLLQRLTLRPMRPGPRIAIVREAGTMTTEAQNALLKMLEEPPGSAVIILVTDNAGAMLTTVRSRCRHLAFGSLSTAEVERVLLGLGRKAREAVDAAACAHGSVSRALELDSEGLAERQDLLLAFEAARRDAAAIEPFVLRLAKPGDRDRRLTELLEWQLAKVESSLGRRPAEPSPELSPVLDASATADPRALIDGAERIRATIDALARNANAKLVIRDMLMNVRA